ncbi:MAG: hypothetical protein KAJ19_17735, partial [Gammaproteobacteria bacterium]|nr:hypothetical protein [Gammaproteobacteria bacterium]
RVADDNGGTHGWRVWENAFKVLNVEPADVKVTVLTPVVTRGDEAMALLTGSDVETPQTELTAQVQYLPPGGSWTDFTEVSYSPGDGGWLATFGASTTAALGTYEVQGRLLDGEYGEQYYGWATNYGNLSVVNSRPQVNSLSLFWTDVLRSGTVTGALEAEDLEDPLSWLKGAVQMSPTTDRAGPGTEVAWTDAEEVYVEGDRIHFEISTDLGFPAGVYNVRAMVTDRDGGESGWSYLNGTLHISNNPPVIEEVECSPPRTLRGGTVILRAEVDDAESPPEDMDLTFWVMTPDGENISLQGEEDGGDLMAFFPTDASRPPGIHEVMVSLSDHDADPGEMGTVWAAGPSFHVINSRPVLHDAFMYEKYSSGEAVRLLVTGSDQDAFQGEPRLFVSAVSPGGEEDVIAEDVAPMDGDTPVGLTQGDPESWPGAIDEALLAGRFVWVLELDASGFAAEGRYSISLKMTDSWGGDSGWAINRTITVEASGTPSYGEDGNDTLPPVTGGEDNPGLLGSSGAMILLAAVAIVIVVGVVIAMVMMVRKKRGKEEAGSP